MTSQKTILRQEAKRHLQRFEIPLEAADNAASVFLNKIQPEKDQVVAAYWTFRRELDTLTLLEKLAEKDIKIALPIVKKNSRILDFAHWTPQTQMKENQYGILEPIDTEKVVPDIVIVPMLAFDRRGYRLGYGGGYYDATLSALRADKDIKAVGYAYAQQAVLFPLPKEDHDQKLDWIVTDQGATCYQRA